MEPIKDTFGHDLWELKNALRDIATAVYNRCGWLDKCAAWVERRLQD